MIVGLLLSVFVSAQIECVGDIVDDIEAAQGGPIELVSPAFTLSAICEMSRPAVITKPTTIDGPGEWFLSINAPAGAFHARAPLMISDVSFWRADWPTDKAAIGVFAEAFIEIENVELSGFTLGIYAWATARERGTNANGLRIRDMVIRGSAHAGILIRGRDANAFNVSSVKIYTSCEHAAKWTAEFGPCANAVDRSFFSGKWESMLLSTAGEIVAGNREKRPAFIADGASQHGNWDSTYCETDQANSTLDRASVAIAGLCNGIEGLGLRIDGPTLSALSITNSQDPTRVVTLRAGTQAAPGSWVDYVAPWDKARPLRRQADVTSRCYRDVIANQLETGRVCQDGTSRMTKPQ